MFLALAKKVLPKSVKKELLARKAKWDGYLESRRNRHRATSEVFSEIYKNNIWGGEDHVLFSGPGSRGVLAEQYADKINEFIKANNVLSVVDVGCGDFHVGSGLKCEDYTGIDVVPDLISHNQATFGTPGRRFLCLDVAGSEPLPSADLVLIRQVLQHLSNAQIETILRKLAPFKYVIVTEHQPSASDFRVANLDHVHGSSTRLLRGSGVYLDKPPFGRSVELLLECPGDDSANDAHNRGPIRSFLVKV